MVHYRRLLAVLVFISLPVWADDILHDPTEPPAWVTDPSQAKSIQQIQLSEIKLEEGRNMAVINGKLAQEGDFIQGYIITKITPNIVYLKNANGAVMVQLIPQPVKSVTVIDLNKGMISQ